MTCHHSSDLSSNMIGANWSRRSFLVGTLAALSTASIFCPTRAMAAAPVLLDYASVRSLALKYYIDPRTDLDLVANAYDAIARWAADPRYGASHARARTKLKAMTDPTPEQLTAATWAYYQALSRLNRHITAADFEIVALSGVFAALDPLCGLQPAEKGPRIGGIGVSLTQQDGNFLVVDTVNDTSPAAKAGIKAGDILTAVGNQTANGKADLRSASTFSLPDFVAALRGPENSIVILSATRPNTAGSLRFRVERGQVRINPINAKLLGDGAALLRLSGFNEGTSQRVSSTIREWQHRNELEGLILDLRGNPGGLLDEAIATAELFLDHGVIVRQNFRSPIPPQITSASQGNLLPDTPVVVLIDERTGSGAELLALALARNNRAKLMGARTAGSANVQTAIATATGNLIKLTTSRLTDSDGISWEGRGVEPDIAFPVDKDDALLDRALTLLRTERK